MSEQSAVEQLLELEQAREARRVRRNRRLAIATIAAVIALVVYLAFIRPARERAAAEQAREDQLFCQLLCSDGFCPASCGDD